MMRNIHDENFGGLCAAVAGLVAAPGNSAGGPMVTLSQNKPLPGSAAVDAVEARTIFSSQVLHDESEWEARWAVWAGSRR